MTAKFIRRLLSDLSKPKFNNIDLMAAAGIVIFVIRGEWENEWWIAGLWAGAFIILSAYLEEKFHGRK